MDKKIQAEKLSMSNTKQEMLNAYNAILKQLQEKSEAELKPEKKIEEKKAKEVVKIADSLSTEGVVKEISNLKLDIGKILMQISDGMEGEVKKFKGIQEAIELKEKELQELYEIERSAATLAALIEAQNQKRQEFELEMAKTEERLTMEIETIRAEWEKEKKDHEAQVRERDAEEKKRRERERDEIIYAFKREQQLAKDNFEDEKLKLEREIQLRKEQMEREVAEREKSIAEREEELNELRKKVGAFPKEMENALQKAVKETTERINLGANNQWELLKREFDGERKVFTTRIESLEKTVKDQSEQITKLSGQLEKAYQKVQDIAVKAVEGSANSKSFHSLQQLMREQTRGQSQEE